MTFSKWEKASITMLSLLFGQVKTSNSSAPAELREKKQGKQVIYTKGLLSLG